MKLLDLESTYLPHYPHTIYYLLLVMVIHILCNAYFTVLHPPHANDLTVYKTSENKSTDNTDNTPINFILNLLLT